MQLRNLHNSSTKPKKVLRKIKEEHEKEWEKGEISGSYSPSTKQNKK